MQILAFNGSPRPQGNTSALVASMMEGARSRGAETAEIRLHDLDFKGCLGCLGCRKNDGFCSAKDGLSPWLEAIKTCAGMIIGCPIYMYRIYSLYASLPQSVYKNMVPPGKTYALITSQGATNPIQYSKSINYLAGMTGSGLGMDIVGEIIHTDSAERPAAGNQDLLEQAFDIGRKMVR